MSLCPVSGADSRSLLTLAAALACYFSKELSGDELGRLAAFFTVLGDILALFALQPDLLRGGEDPCGRAAGTGAEGV